MGRLQRLLGREVTATICKHQTGFKGRVDAFNAHIHTHMPRNVRGSTDYCLDCIGKMAILCAWCGEPIFIGDPITLYAVQSADALSKQQSGQGAFEFVHDSDLGVRLRKHTAIYRVNPLQVVGCLRWKCADTGADRAGFWTPGTDGKGTVERVRTVFEEMIYGDVTHVGIGDLSDQSTSTLPTPGEKPINSLRIV